MIAANIADYRELARRSLPRVLFDYVDGGSYAETTLARNSEDFKDVYLRQRVLKDVSKLHMATEVLGQPMSMPLVLSPVGMAGMYARRGEVQAARAARKAGLPMCLSSMSICDVEEVTKGCGAPIWFQLYVMKDRGYMESLMARAVDLGCPVLAFTVDLPRPGSRYRDARNGLNGKLPPWEALKRGWDGVSHPRWVWDIWMNGRPHTFGNIGPAIPEAKSLDAFWGYISTSMDVITWKDIAWVRKHFPGKIILKGLLDVEDAREAAKHGVDGIVVSNHGGRQLDGAPSSISALPAIADAVGDDMTVLMDGGIRSGLDVLKALSSGAKACLLGRAWAYGLAAKGEAGVTHVLDIIRAELATAMALTGCTDIRKADASLLAQAREALADAASARPAAKPAPIKRTRTR